MSQSQRNIATIGLILLAVLSLAGLGVTFVIDKTPDANVVDTFKLIAVTCVTAVAGITQWKPADG